MKNTLGLGGDGDEIELIEEIETAFDIQLSNSELEKTENVGQLFDRLSAYFEDAISTKCCFSAHVFYRLRSSLSCLGLNEKIRPGTNLKQIIGPQEHWPIKRRLEESTGLRLPSLCMGPIQTVGCFTAAASILLPVLFSSLLGWPFIASIPVLLAVLAVGLKLIRTEYGQRLGIEYSDIRCLTRLTVAMNYGHLVGQLGYPGKNDLWKALTRLLEHWADSGIRAAEINRQTRLISP